MIHACILIPSPSWYESQQRNESVNRDANLQSGDYLFFTTPTPPDFNGGSPQGQTDPAPMVMAQDITQTYKNAAETLNCTMNKKNSNFQEKMA